MPTISLAGPADLLSVIPFHLGFVPRRSVVVVCLHGKRVGLLARFDLSARRARGPCRRGSSGDARAHPADVGRLVGFEDVPGESSRLSEALRSRPGR